MNDEVIKILERIATAIETNNELLRSERAAEMELERRREKNRKRMQRNRGSDLCAHESVRAHEVVERNEEEKRDIPPTPPIERKEEEKKDLSPRAREEVENEVVVETEEEPKQEDPKPKKSKPKFVKPTIEEIDAYCREKGYNVDAETFWNFYESKDWMVGENKMSKWHSAIVTWVKRRSRGCKSAAKPEFRRVDPNGPNPMGLRNFIGADASIMEKIHKVEETKK